jgi:hypothetical protein
LIKVGVITNIKFYEKTLPSVIPSLVSAGISKEDIHIFNNGHSEYKCVIEDDISHHFLDHHSNENSLFITVLEKELYSEYWFLIHDTARVGPNFKTLLYNIPENKPEKMAMTTYPSGSMGSYRYDYLLSIKEKVMSYRNQWRFAPLSNEDSILWKTDPPAVCYNGYNEYCRQLINNDDNWFGTSTRRITEYYPSLDLYKNKANFGQHVYLKSGKIEELNTCVWSHHWEDDIENTDPSKYRKL